MRDVVGNPHAQGLLERAVRTNRVAHAYLLTGPANIGKTTLAMALARVLQCTRRDPASVEACGECASCQRIAHGNHPDVAVVEPPLGKRWLPIESVRELRHTVNLAPYEGRWRVVVLPGAERMEAEAVNALLKTLEEPPEQVVLILTCEEPDLLLPTLVSRCQLIPMSPLGAEEVRAALVERWGVEADEAAALAGLAGGRLGWAVEAHRRPELRERRDALLTRILEVAAAPASERMRLMAALAAEGEGARSAVETWTLWWHDVLLAALGSDALNTAGLAREAAERLGRALEPERAEAFLRRLVETYRQLDQNANPRLALEVLALDFPAGRSGARAQGQGGSNARG